MRIQRCLLMVLIGWMLTATARPSSADDVKSLWTRKAGQDWPGFLGVNRDSVSPEKGIIPQWPRTGPRIAWSAEIGEGYVGPTVVKGRLLQFHRVKGNMELLCLNAETGQKLWAFTYPTEYEDMYGYDGGPRAQPVVDEDRVYIQGADGMLHCVTLAEGKEVWKVDTKRQFGVVQNFFGEGSAPAVEGDLLLAMVGGSPPSELTVSSGRLRGNGSGIVAFDKRTGQVRYKLSDELASYSSIKLATIGGQRYGFAFMRGGLLAFDPVAGKERFFYPWRARVLESVNASTPVVWDDKVFISECYGPGSSLLKVTPGKGEGYEVIWKDEGRRNLKMQTHWNTSIHVNGFLYGSSGRNKGDAELRCIDAATGELKWSKEGLHRASLLHVDGHLVCLTESGALLLLKVNSEKYDLVTYAIPMDETTGRPLLAEPAWAAPVLSHGLMYVRGRGRLVCMELIPQSPVEP